MTPKRPATDCGAVTDQISGEWRYHSDRSPYILTFDQVEELLDNSPKKDCLDGTPAP